MIIGGLQKFSLIDYPGKTCATIFTQGCNFHCRYCHNPELVLPDQFGPTIALTTVYQFLKKRKNKLEAICITGGEPTLHQDLIPVMQKIKNMGFLVKLDTNGTKPAILAKAIKLNCVNYLAMDIKAPLEKYSQIVDQPVAVADIKKSIRLIIDSGIEHEFRTTIVKSLISSQDLIKIGQTIQGAQKYYLQKFIPSKLVDPALMKNKSYSQQELEKIAKKIKQWVEICEVR